jgi:hypothetical protein
MPTGFQAVSLVASRTFAMHTQTVTAAQAAQTTTPVVGLFGLRGLMVQAAFVYGSGGTTAKYWIQTSLDAGASWIDVMCFAFTTATAKKVSGVRMDIALAAGITPTDGTLADNTILDGLLGDRIRVKYTTVGTYAGSSTIAIHATALG